MTSISAGHIILTPTQLVGSGRPQRGSNPGPPDQESRALPTELPRPPFSDANPVSSLSCHRPCRSILQVVAKELLHCFVIVDRAAGTSTLSLK